MNKFEELDKVKLIGTDEYGTIVDIYEFQNNWYYQVELDDKTDDRDIIECQEDELEKIEE